MQRVYKMGLPSRTYWTGYQPIQKIEKNYETLPEDSFKNKESNNKKMAHNFEPEWGRADRDNAMCSW